MSAGAAGKRIPAYERFGGYRVVDWRWDMCPRTPFIRGRTYVPVSERWRFVGRVRLVAVALKRDRSRIRSRILVT
ncbi:MAG: hypothetical protein F4X18_02440 [Acidimicrobiia bacterium]|nr:hypothetical protein [Acidimicrobiia bacterium]